MFICVLNSYLKVHGIRTLFELAKEPKLNMTMVYLVSTEVFFGISVVVMRGICYVHMWVVLDD